MTNHIFMKAKKIQNGELQISRTESLQVLFVFILSTIYTPIMCAHLWQQLKGRGGSYTLIGWTILVCICCERPECSSINLSSVNDKFKTCKIVHKKSGWIDNVRWMPSCSNDMTNLNVFFPYDLIQCTCKMCQDIVVWNCLLKKLL